MCGRCINMSEWQSFVFMIEESVRFFFSSGFAGAAKAFMRFHAQTL